ncbi:MAG: ABC transporter permease [Anaerolineae bacterium]|nr:ABC transporter permease [Anaerolineae bacterium]
MLESKEGLVNEDSMIGKGRSLWADAWRRLISNNTARLGMAIVAIFVLSTVLAHFFWEYNPKTDLDYSLKLKPPTLVPNEEVPSIHPFGTDKLGRDIFRRVVHGGWNSLRVGFVSVGISLAAGGILGLLAGFYESMALGRLGRVILLGGIGLAFGAISAWLAGQIFQVALFFLLGVAGVFYGIQPTRGKLPEVKPGRVLAFGAGGLLISAGPALLVSPYTAVACGILGTLTGILVALPLGGQAVSNVIMRVMDIILAFPAYLLAIAIVAFLGPGLNKAMIAIGFVGIPVYARLVRSTVLSVTQNEYVLAARGIGVGYGRLLVRHIVPNTVSPVIVQVTMGLASAILWAGALGFLGLGAIPPEPEWGAILGDSYRFLTSGAWWAVLFPGLAIMFSVLGFNLLGDGLRDALDPSLTR